MEYSLRPAVETDRPFLHDLHCTTMRRYVDTTWGWAEIWQLSHFDRHSGDKEISIVEVGGHAVGALWVKRHSGAIYIADLQIMPEHQRRGIGTAIFQSLIREAVSLDLPLELAVLPVNQSARKLYDRLGFKAIGNNGPFIQMRYAKADPMP